MPSTPEVILDVPLTPLQRRILELSLIAPVIRARMRCEIMWILKQGYDTVFARELYAIRRAELVTFRVPPPARKEV